MVNVKIKYRCSCGEEVVIRLDDSFHIDFPYCLKCGLMMSEVSRVLLNSDNMEVDLNVLIEEQKKIGEALYEIVWRGVQTIKECGEAFALLAGKLEEEDTEIKNVD